MKKNFKSNSSRRKEVIEELDSKNADLKDSIGQVKKSQSLYQSEYDEEKNRYLGATVFDITGTMLSSSYPCR